MNTPFVSIIIPAYNDHQRLALCLDHLVAQSYPASQFEVIVVDNGSKPPLDDIVAAYPNGRIYHETQPGSYIARNTGIIHAQGEIIVFTDSDCLPMSDWLTAGVAAITADPQIGLVAGRIDVFAQDPHNPTLAEQYEVVRGFPIQEYIERWHFGATANIFTRRDVLTKVGDFDATLKSGGDSEWCKRVHAAGYQTVYSDTAIIRHPARQTVGAIWRKARRVAGGLHDIDSRQNPPSAYLRYGFWRDVIPPIKKTAALLQQEGYTLGQRLQLVYVEWVYNYGRTYERVRLIFGGNTRRS